jgi:2-polyprenyl-3-methyl-5-hydroxy-6-metoxy-1,4-benzoquinol methylase/Flp pilus assembly protein TadD
VADRVNKLLKRAAELHRSGDLANADAVCRKILSKHPGHVDVLNLRGIIAGQTGRIDAAVDYFRQALAGAPNHGAVMTNLAEALRLQGKVAEAVPLLRRATIIAPRYAAADYKLATALLNLGRPDEALTACEAGLRRYPDEANLNGLATDLLIQRQQPVQAMAYLFKALAQAPADDRNWQRLNRVLREVVLPPREGRRWLFEALAHPVIRPSEIAASVANTLCRDSAIAALANRIEDGEPLQGEALGQQLASLSKDVLLLRLMATTTIPQRTLERVFTGLRRALLLEPELRKFGPDVLPFCAALATQSFMTDYAWYVTDEEEAQLDSLTSRLGVHLREEHAPESPALMLALAGAYRPLHRLEDAARITRRSWPAALSELLRLQVSEPLEERVLQEQIPRLTPVANPVSQQVRAQYEENPYPRWGRAYRAVRRTSLRELFVSLGATYPADPSFAAPEVLIAGCGTGQQAVLASTSYDNAGVLAIDLSLASLAYAWRKTRELGIGNIDYQQADITELRRLGRSFHVIECGGVLHHLEDPLAGWRVLVDLLRPGGVMFIALYSELARRPVVRARAQIAARGYAATAADIRRCRHEILALPDDDPLASLRSVRDLYNVSECRDLLFHVQEHRFTLPQIKEALDQLGLRLLTMANELYSETYRKRFPDDPRMTSLDNWHLIEQEHPDAFVGMYAFWVQKV